jgi:hypothetical protein
MLTVASLHTSASSHNIHSLIKLPQIALISITVLLTFSALSVVNNTMNYAKKTITDKVAATPRHLRPIYGNLRLKESPCKKDVK